VDLDLDPEVRVVARAQEQVDQIKGDEEGHDGDDELHARKAGLSMIHKDNLNTRAIFAKLAGFIKDSRRSNALLAREHHVGLLQKTNTADGVNALVLAQNLSILLGQEKARAFATVVLDHESQAKGAV